MRLHADLYLGSEAFASGNIETFTAISVDTAGVAREHVHGSLSFSLQGNHRASDYIRTELIVDNVDPHPGWISGRACVQVNGLYLDRDVYKPFAFYVGEATDWPSGLVRYVDPYTLPDSKIPGVWTLALRRSM